MRSALMIGIVMVLPQGIVPAVQGWAAKWPPLRRRGAMLVGASKAGGAP